MKQKLQRLYNKMRAAETAFAAAVSAEQQVCKHKTQEECDYLPSNYGNALPPVRVCCDCGMTEDGWCCGYIVLKGPAKPISRETLYAKRQGFALRAEHKGPLLRHEASLAQLIAHQARGGNHG